MEHCEDCDTEIEAEALFCVGCGAPVLVRATPVEPIVAAITLPICPLCGAACQPGDEFCSVDGTSLAASAHLEAIGEPQWQPSRKADPEQIEFANPEPAWRGYLATTVASLKTFWGRHQILFLVTLMAISGIALRRAAVVDIGELGEAICIALLIATILSWPVALWRSEKVLTAVGRFDGWFDRSHTYANNSEQPVVRWGLRPIMWLSERSVSLSQRAPDQFAAASLRTFFYSATILVLAALAFFVAVVLIALALLVLGLFVIGFILSQMSDEEEGDEERKRERLQRQELERQARERLLGHAGRKTGREQLLHSGKSWWSEERTGRIDEKGHIHSGKSWWSEERTGRVDDKGNLYEGDNWWTEEKVGSIDDKGNIYQGASWWSDVKVGRIDDEGHIQSGESWWSEERTGRIEKKK